MVKADNNKLDTVDENADHTWTTPNAIDTLENAIASEKMWRSSVNEDSKEEEIERELNGKIADPMDVPFFDTGLCFLKWHTQAV